MQSNYFVGQCCSLVKTISNEDIQDFARISGDYNPIHVDPEYAENSIFKKQIAHGMLSASYISSILGTKFPGIGTIYMEQNLRFLKPVFVNETIEITVEIAELREKGRAVLNTIVTNSNKEVVVEGVALVKLPSQYQGV